MKLHLAAFGELLSRYGRAFALSWKHRKEFESVPRSKEEGRPPGRRRGFAEHRSAPP